MDFEAAFETLGKRSNGDRPDWWHAARSEAFAAFRHLGFPTRRHEEWKYTDVRSIAKRPYRLPAAAPVAADLSAVAMHRSPDDLEFVFVDGVYAAAQSTNGAMPDGVWAGPLSEAVESRRELVSGAVCVDGGCDSFTALNTAFLDQGIVIDIEPKQVVPVTIHIIHVVSGDGADLMAAPHTIVRVGAHSEVRVMESFLSTCDDEYFVNHVADIEVAENAHLQHVLVQSQGSAAMHIGTTRIRQAAHSRVATFAYESGARLARHNLNVMLDGEGTHTSLDGLYLAGDRQHVDNHTVIDHQFPHGTSDQLYKGILRAESRAVFNGKILVRPIAQQTNAYQLNRNLMLGDGCKVDSKPQLEIFADDVKCTHGATIGHLNEDELFYLQSRAISREAAIALLSQGYARDAIERVRNENLRARVERHLAEDFAGMHAGSPVVPGS